MSPPRSRWGLHPINKCLGDGDVVDGGGADEGDGAYSPRGLGVVAGVEGDLVLKPLEGMGCLYLREDSIDLSRDPLEVTVGEGGLCPAEDAYNVALGS